MPDPNPRGATYLSSEAPTTEELSQLADARRRVLDIIKIRWAVLGILLAYGVCSFFLQRLEAPREPSSAPFLIGVLAFSAAVLYNAWYHYSYRWLSRLRRLTLIQLLIDLLFLTAIVHFTGGMDSWLWTLYLVLILQASFLGETARDAWTIGVAAVLLYGILMTLELRGTLAPLVLPFEEDPLQREFGHGLLRWAWVSALCLLASGIGSFMIRGIKEHENQLETMVNKDAHTAIYNRRYFYLRLNSELERAARYGRTFSLLILDVDDFKKVNDRHGHQVGDQLLQGVAGVLQQNIRRRDASPAYDIDIPCRIGGEEFAVIMPEASSVQGSTAAERLRTNVEAQGAASAAEHIRERVASLDLRGIRLTVSIGVASFPEHATDVDTLFRLADDAMYQAKRSGKNRVITARPASAQQPGAFPGITDAGPEIRPVST